MCTNVYNTSFVRAGSMPHSVATRLSTFFDISDTIASHLPADAARRRPMPRRAENRQKPKSLGAKPIEFCAPSASENAVNAGYRCIRRAQNWTLLHRAARCFLELQI